MYLTMYLTTLDKKLHIVNHKISKTEIAMLAEQHKLSLKEIEEEIKKQILFKFLPIIDSIFEKQSIAEEEHLTINVRGFILSERQLFEILLEVLELDDDFKYKMKQSIYKYLGIHSQVDRTIDEQNLFDATQGLNEKENAKKDGSPH